MGQPEGPGRWLGVTAALLVSTCLLWIVRVRSSLSRDDRRRTKSTPVSQSWVPRPPHPNRPQQPPRTAAIQKSGGGTGSTAANGSANVTPNPSPVKLPKSGSVGRRLGGTTPKAQRRSLSDGVSFEVQEQVRIQLANLPGPEVVGNKRIELLVHNVSHKDMVLSLGPTSDAAPPGGSKRSDGLVVCRPKFSLFQKISVDILEELIAAPGLETAYVPVHARQREDSRVGAFTLRPESSEELLPVGFDMSECGVAISDLSNFRIRRDDTKKLVGDQYFIGGVYFPLMASIIPKWKRVVVERVGNLSGTSHDARDDGVVKLVFLVSGVGMPRDSKHPSWGNSTRGTAELIEQFLHNEYPDLLVVRVHSRTNIFRYDENIAFVKQELLPLVEWYRDLQADRWGTDWRSKYHLTISFADGSPARIAAISASLRPYHPSYMHMWELKTFWHEEKMCLDDVEFHSFEDIDTLPPTHVNHADEMVQMVAKEMIEYKQEVLQAFAEGLCKDLDKFWLRKTMKPVLAVLVVQKEGEDAVLYRGCNMEVSMPTGSLCAERNAIGSALAADLSLKRRDLKMVAVLSIQLREPSRGLAACSPILSSQKDPTSMYSTSPIMEKSLLSLNLPPAHSDGSSSDDRHHTLAHHASPAKVIRTYSISDLTRCTPATISVDPGDLNPLKPCGACMEWLKKIAENNPRFTVLTFTDENCVGVYTESISTW